MLGKESHVLEVSCGESTHFRKRVFQVLSQAINDLGAPSLLMLAMLYLSSDPVVKRNQFGVDSQRRPLPSVCDVAFDLLQPVGVANGEQVMGGSLHGSIS